MDQYGIADRTGHTYNGTTYQFGGLKRDLSALNSYLTNESGFLADDGQSQYDSLGSGLFRLPARTYRGQ